MKQDFSNLLRNTWTTSSVFCHNPYQKRLPLIETSKVCAKQSRNTFSVFGNSFLDFGDRRFALHCRDAIDTEYGRGLEFRLKHFLWGESSRFQDGNTGFKGGRKFCLRELNYWHFSMKCWRRWRPMNCHISNHIRREMCFDDICKIRTWSNSKMTQWEQYLLWNRLT